jgi:hypothetical protein
MGRAAADTKYEEQNEVAKETDRPEEEIDACQVHLGFSSLGDDEHM